VGVSRETTFLLIKGHHLKWDTMLLKDLDLLLTSNDLREVNVMISLRLSKIVGIYIGEYDVNVSPPTSSILPAL